MTCFNNNNRESSNKNTCITRRSEDCQAWAAMNRIRTGLSFYLLIRRVEN